MMKLTAFTAALCICIAGLGACSSNPPELPPQEDKFQHMDIDGDGFVSKFEAEHSSKRLAQNFDSADTNGDGLISLTEFLEYRRLQDAPSK